MPKRIAIIQGHPDTANTHLCHALGTAYAKGAEEAGHEVTNIHVAALDFPWLRSKDQFEKGDVPASLVPSQEAIVHADHLVIIYPLWLGSMPALLKAYLEQVIRPGFAFTQPKPGHIGVKRLRGKSARVIVTMGMPAPIYRWFFGAHSLKSLERNILGFCGIGPIKESLFGSVETASDDKRQTWLAIMQTLGRAGN